MKINEYINQLEKIQVDESVLQETVNKIMDEQKKRLKPTNKKYVLLFYGITVASLSVLLVYNIYNLQNIKGVITVDETSSFTDNSHFNNSTTESENGLYASIGSFADASEVFASSTENPSTSTVIDEETSQEETSSTMEIVADTCEPEFIVWNNLMYIPQCETGPESVGDRLTNEASFYQFKNVSTEISIIYNTAFRHIVYNSVMSSKIVFNNKTYYILDPCIDYKEDIDSSHKKGFMIGEYDSMPIYSDLGNDNYIYVYTNPKIYPDSKIIRGPYLAELEIN